MMLSKNITILVLALMTPVFSYAFDSGSNGADGAFNPTANIELPLSPSGVFNFTTVNIPAGITVTFTKNAANTPVIMLASGDVTIDGTINVRGTNSGNTDDGNITDDALPGIGGPGGFDGGKGGYIFTGTNDSDNGTHGQGPGGGSPGTHRGNCSATNIDGAGGGGASYGSLGGTGAATQSLNAPAGSIYGNDSLFPLVGGSGGGGGNGSTILFASGGGGGGGAILLSSSGTITINGTINANGGNSGSATRNGVTSCSSTGNTGGSGGGGSGGAIRIVATTIQGTGTITAVGGISGNARQKGGVGGAGRIRLEAENMLFTVQTNPAFSTAAPNPVFAPNFPSINITSVAGITAPVTPTGSNDIVLPENTPNPVTVVFATSNIPSGGTIALTATPTTGGAVTATSIPILADGTATASISLPNGPSTLIASTTFTVTASLGKDFSNYAMGEQVEKVRVGINPQGQSETTFITKSGKEFTWPSNVIAMN